MAQALTKEERIALIQSSLQEVLRPDIIEQVMIKEDRPLVIYWGTCLLTFSTA
jgi:tyrosyl-tRNA synthetase